MVERTWKPRADAALRIAAALIGTLPAAVLAAVCLARFLPLAEPTRFMLGFMLAIPLWVAAICFAFLGRSAARAWGLCLAASAVLAALAIGMPT